MLRYLMLTIVLLSSQFGNATEATNPWQIRVPAAQFQRHFLTNPDALPMIQKVGNLSGRKGRKGIRTAGWVEYDFKVPSTGWYELFIDPLMSGHEFRIDAIGFINHAGSFWLKEGEHTFRIEKRHWTGLRAITGWRLRALTSTDQNKAFRVHIKDNRTLLRKGESLSLELTGGGAPGQSAPVKLDVLLLDKNKNILSQQQIAFRPGEVPQRQNIDLPCPHAGPFSVAYRINGVEQDASTFPNIKGLAIDTTPHLGMGKPLRKELIKEIDCALTPPDYFGGGDTRVTEKPFGKYRESGELGWFQYMNNTDPGWFAYTFTVPESQRPYYFEVDFPDDAIRTFCFSVREGNTGGYPTTAGADTGGEFALSNTMQTQGILHWARGTDLRLVCMTPQTGSRAVAARIRLYALPDNLPVLPVARKDGRSYAHWYEEGGGIYGLYAAPNGSLEGAAVASDRWARTVAWVGGDTLIYTMAVYQFGLYPSRYNTSFTSQYTADKVGALLYACEKYGLKFVGEFHAAASELNRPDAGCTAKENIAVNRLGEVRRGNVGPNFTPLHPRNRAWYLGMLGEFVARYKDSPAFDGISLRLMSWVNPGHNNFDSQEWGYDDYTVNLFSKETGRIIPGPPEDPARFKIRYEWLKKNAWNPWLDWRCAKITALHRQIVEATRKARADLKVYIKVSIPKDLRGAGIDIAALEKIPGIVLLGGTSYGRKSRNLEGHYAQRESLTNPEKLKKLCTSGRPGNFIFGSAYFEATGKVVPHTQLGYSSRLRPSWTSGVVNPAGRSYLERYALAMAEADAQFLGDGGNAYIVGQAKELQEFLTEYRALPAIAFTKRKDARDPVAVWENQSKESLDFYAVNRESSSVTIHLEFLGKGKVRRLATGKDVALKNNQLTLTLKPFQLLSFTACSNLRIKQIKTDVSVCHQNQSQRLADWVRTYATTWASQKGLTAAQKSLLKKTAEATEEDRRNGHVWRQRTRLEGAALQKIYQTTLQYPPLAYPRPMLWRLKGKGNRSKAKRFPQTDLSQPGSLAHCIKTKSGMGETQLIAGQEYLGGLASFAGQTATLHLPFSSSVAMRFRVWIRLAGGEGCAGLLLGNATSQQDAIFSITAPGLHVVNAGLVSLASGESTVRLNTVGEGQVYLDQFYFEPILTPVMPLAFAAYFPNLGQKNWEAPLPPETPDGQKSTAVFKGTDGKSAQKVRWVPYPDGRLRLNSNKAIHGVWEQVKSPPGPLGKEVVGYCRTIITAPTSRKAKITIGATSQIRLWINGELIIDSMKEKLNLIWTQGPNTREIQLKKGENVMLAKVGNAGIDKPNYHRLFSFNATISDPGDLSFHSGLTPVVTTKEKKESK